MQNPTYNNKKIEELATIAVKERLSMTDTLSQYINENDKTPSWDGYVIIYRSNRTNKEDIVGKVTVQVKGASVSNVIRDECSFSVDMADLVNYKNDGGTIYFVVLMDKNNLKKKRVFYDTLTPLKIDNYLKGHVEQYSRVINLKRLPGDKYKIHNIFLNFYHDSRKQRSFIDIPPITFQEAISRKDIVKIICSSTIFSPDKNLQSTIRELFNNDVYWYAEIASSPIPHPIEFISDIAIIKKGGFRPIFVNGERYDNYITERQTNNDVTIQFGKSTTFVFTKKDKGAKMNFQLSGLLSDRIKDLSFIMSIIESGEIDFGGNQKVALSQMVAENPFDVVYARRELESYKRIEQFLKSLQVIADFDIGNIDSNSSLDELNILVESMNGKKLIRVNIDGEYTSYMLHKSISNLNILLFIVAEDKEKSLYRIYNFFDYMGTIKIKRGDIEYTTSPYSVLTPDDYLELSNINLSNMLQSYKDLINLSDNIFEPANYDLLNLLLAYDKHSGHHVEIYETAKEIARWLLDESADKLQEEIKTINYLQTIKRARELTSEENVMLYHIAENMDSSIMIKLAANLLLDNYKIAKIQFDQLSDQEKEIFRSYPIFKFWK